MPSIFISHNHSDKPFARRLTVDLAALGAKVWLDEAEMNIGDSLIDKIEKAIDEVEFLAVVLSPASVASAWVREELKQALSSQLEGRGIRVLPLMLRNCTTPGFLREKLYADFRVEEHYEDALLQLASSIGLKINEPYGSTVRDPFSSRFGRVESFYTRPQIWHCIYCGWKCVHDYDNYFCHECKSIRPFFAPSATMRQCNTCKQWNIGISVFCEWCGLKLHQ